MNSTEQTNNESNRYNQIQREMLRLCAKSWEENGPKPDLDQEVSLRFGHSANLPWAPKAPEATAEDWETWLNKVTEKFPMDPEDLERFKQVEPEIRQEVAQGIVESHLSADPL